jgi:PAS domain S-box-containing protein
MRISCFIVFLFLGIAPLFGQSFTFNQQIRGVDLPSETIRGLLQDAKGRIWFNTSMGVFYSDGVSTFPIPAEIQSQLSKDIGMFLDKDGWIWLFNHNKSAKIFFYDHRSWNELKLPERIFSQATELYKRVVISGSNHKKKVILLDEEKLYVLDKPRAKWISFDLPYAQVGYYFSHWEAGNEFFLIFESAIVSLDQMKPVFIEVSNPFSQERIYHIAKDGDTYYFLGKNFLAKGSSSRQIDKILVSGFQEPKYTHIDFTYLQVKNGKVYFFFNSQLMQYDPALDRIFKIGTLQSLRSYSLTSALVDREDIIWLASTRGLVNVPSLMFVNYNRMSFLDDEITALHPLGPQEYLVGFNNGLQHWKDSNVFTIQHFPDLYSQPKFRITNIASDKNGQIWLSSNQQGVGRYFPEKKQVEYFNTPVPQEIIGVFPVGDSLFISAKNKLFLASIYDKPLELFRQEITEDWRRSSRLKEFYIRKIGALKDGKLMVMLGGNVYTNDSVTVTPRKFFVVGFDYIELDTAVLIATDKGLKVFNDKGLRDFTHHGQSVNRPVYALLQDDQQRIWAGTDKGMFVINDTLINNYSERSGLAGTEINRGALIKNSLGQILIGTHKGLSVFSPSEENVNIPAPPVEITSLTVLNAGNEVDIQQIPSTNNSIEITYLAPSFLQSLDYILHYYLEGFHEEWIQLVNPMTNVVTFSNLPPGTYRFHMKISLGELIETPVVSSSEFTILKPVYLRFWFIIAVLLVFFLIGYLVSFLLTQLKEKGILKKAIDEKIYEAAITEDQFRNVWLSSKDGLSLTRDDGKIIAVNPALASLVGISEKDLEEMNLWEIFSDPLFYDTERKRIEDIIVAQGSNTLNLEIQMPFHSGDKVIDYFSTELKSEFNGKKVFLSVFHDITKQRRQEVRLKEAKEKAEEASRIKTNFLSNMSHEIRTPLNGILGTAEHIIHQRANEQELVDQLEIIRESGERLLQTINSILDLSKIESNKMDIQYQETNINDFVAKVLLPLKALAMKKDLLLTSKYEQVPFVGKIDRRYLEMIINNLVGNAIKYSQRGLVSVKVGKLGQYLILEVKDQGIGMSSEFMDRIYQPFEQESDGYVRKFEGTGLGLAITKNLVTLLKGSISLESEKDVGTKVLVSIPLL